jgi:predicted RNA binding protein YcfA (HicA-like mRNA interferase family)
VPPLPVIKDRELIQVLHKLGFSEHRETGSSHLIFRHLDGRRVVIARHAGKDIPRGTLRAILHDINISIEDFNKLL